ncbi:hypothetical protein [Butyrivibrio sp. VCB2006]|uniref:hypothetical protein n=1 Tax=Butyrivibrio sp. VCB2006 TaxID=1280679 RepID=UPI00041EF00C|nr:hypothetical protein [Butyrivibrio sp. VCB2006]
MKIHSVKESNDISRPALYLIAGLAFTCAVALTGCGKDNNVDTSLSISKDGKITNTIYEDFGQDYYDISELSNMATEEISYYNSEYDLPRISLNSAEILEDEAIAKLVMTFESSSDFSHYNQTKLFYGTVQEAMELGYELSSSLVDKNGDKIDLGSNDFMDRHIVITGEKTVIYTPYNIEYITSGVTIRDKKEADLTNVTTDMVQILLSK